MTRVLVQLQRQRRLCLALTILSAATLRAQTPNPLAADVTTPGVAASAAATITVESVGRELGVLMADSLCRRVTPSAALERTARYVAAEFQRFGLQPGSRNQLMPTWIQWYPVPGQARTDLGDSQLLFMLALKGRNNSAILDEIGDRISKNIELNFTTHVYFTPEVGRQMISWKQINPFLFSRSRSGNPLVLMAGRHTANTVRHLADQLRGTIVLYVPATDMDSAARRSVIAELYAVSDGVIIVSDVSATSFAAERAARQQFPTMVDQHLWRMAGLHHRSWAATIWAGAVREFVAVAGADLAQLRDDTLPVIQRLPSNPRAVFAAWKDSAIRDSITAPNVIGVLEGSDAKFKDQYIVLSTPMDAPLSDTTSGSADRTPCQAGRVGDNVAGVAGLLAVAKAFSQPELRPRRSVIFLATSGETSEFWGVNYFINYASFGSSVRALKVNLTLDLAGPWAGDSLWIDGLRDVELKTSPEWVARMHPELSVLVADGGTAVRPRSSHFPFVLRTVPSLWLHATNDSTLSGGTGVIASPDAERVARLARYFFFISHTITAADEPPRWTTEGREQMATVVEP